jgi:hypothetical protein
VPPARKKVRKVKLACIAHVRTELARVYRRADAGIIPWQDATCAARLLRELRVIFESSDLEARVLALEARLAEGIPPKSNGHDHAAAAGH